MVTITAFPKGSLFTSAIVLMGLILAAAPNAVNAGADEAKTFYAEKCEPCHTIAGTGGKMAMIGGPLDGVGSKRTAEWLREYIKDPKSKMPEAKMPKIPMTDQQLDDMVAYLSTLKEPAK
jgi:cytochrome c2